MRRRPELRPTLMAVLVIGIVGVGLMAQAGAHLLGLTAPPQATAVEPVSAYAETGPHPVGVRRFPSRSETPDFTMWYPAGDSDRQGRVSYAYGVRLFGPAVDTALATFEGRASRAAPFDDATAGHPLVVLSHGFAITGSSYGWLAEHLASHGMVVVAPDHRESLDPGRLWHSTVQRPDHVRSTLDDLEARAGRGGELEGVVDMSRIAVVGHSYGGYTALAVGGAEVDPEAFRSNCDVARSTGDPITFLCDALEPNSGEIVEAAASRPPLGHGIDAVVSIAGDAAMFGESGLAALKVPVMAIGGTADTATPYEWGPALTFEHAGSERRVEVALEGAEHLVFAGSCDAVRRLMTVVDLGFCSDPVWSRDAAHAVVKHHVAAFLRSELMGDREATVLLGRSALEISGVRYRAEGF